MGQQVCQLNELRVLGVDDVVWSTPDTPESRQELGCCTNQHGPGVWPQIRAVCLMGTCAPGPIPHDLRLCLFLGRPPARLASPGLRSHSQRVGALEPDQIRSDQA